MVVFSWHLLSGHLLSLDCCWFCWIFPSTVYCRIVVQLLWTECMSVCEFYIENISHISRGMHKVL